MTACVFGTRVSRGSPPVSHHSGRRAASRQWMEQTHGAKMADADSWDADNFDNLEPDVPVKKGVVLDKWEGEDEEEDVKDNWDDEEVEEKKEEKKAEVKVSEKKKLSEKIKEKEKKQRKKQEELKKRLEEPEAPAEMTPEEEFEEKLRVRKMQEEADLKLAQEAFGVNNVTGIDDMNPSSKDDFTEFENLLKEKISQYEKSIHYSSFLESLFRDLCTSLEVEDLKRINNSLTVLFNEKQKQEKQNKAKKKKNKGVMPGGGLKAKLKDDLADYGGFEGGYVQDYEDFM
ncbi:eukaryotic translation initiation factor 3 subunit J-A-like isoform X2 [Polyodon spathula]|uniref:eukaryotic translation initiation factor 3 subunit J-A-like isoform X2 n=1 Tax=Polyodon spathula TaxID=7913 RepID=UPI001B7F33BE|nr:eukaryotic translation initiation factor 3 subunit J-A-like isoform X2 [Polyodon spathula]